MVFFKRSSSLKGQKSKTVVITVELPKGQLIQQQQQEQKSDSSLNTTESKSWGFRWIINLFSSSANNPKISDETLSNTDPNNSSTGSISSKENLDLPIEKGTGSGENELSSSESSLHFDDRDDSPSSVVKLDSREVTTQGNKNKTNTNRDNNVDEANNDENVADFFINHPALHDCSLEMYNELIGDRKEEDDTRSSPRSNPNTKTSSSLPPLNNSIRINEYPDSEPNSPTKPMKLIEMRRTASNASKNYIHVFHNQLTTLQERPSREDCDSDNESDIHQQGSRGHFFDEAELRNRWNYSLEVMARAEVQNEKKARMRRLVDRYMQ